MHNAPPPEAGRGRFRVSLAPGQQYGAMVSQFTVHPQVP
jgi:hypothetical protein